MNYHDSDGPYAGVFLRVQVAGVGGSNGQWLRTAHVKGDVARSWRVTCAPMVPTSRGGQAWNPDYMPVWGAEPQGAMSGALGRVTWGDGQVQHVSLFDWRRGGTFVVHGTYVEVDVMATLQGAIIGPVDPLLHTGAHIAPAKDSASGEAVISLHTGEIAGNVPESIPAHLDTSYMPSEDTVLSAAVSGSSGNLISLECIADGAGAGTLDIAGFPAIVWHFHLGVTTVADFEAAVTGSGVIVVQTPGTPGFWQGVSAAHFFSGGVDAGMSYATLEIPPYTKYFRFYQTENLDPSQLSGQLQFACADDALGIVGLRQANPLGVMSSGGVYTSVPGAGADPRGWWQGIEGTSRWLFVTNFSTYAIGGWVEFLLDVG